MYYHSMKICATWHAPCTAGSVTVKNESNFTSDTIRKSVFFRKTQASGRILRLNQKWQNNFGYKLCFDRYFSSLAVKSPCWFTCDDHAQCVVYMGPSKANGWIELVLKKLYESTYFYSLVRQKGHICLLSAIQIYCQF